MLRQRLLNRRASKFGRRLAHALWKPVGYNSRHFLRAPLI